MKKYLILVLILFSIHLNAQKTIYGEVTYLVSLKKENAQKTKSKDSLISRKVKELFKNAHDVNFILEFNSNESIYKKSKTLKNDLEASINLTEIMAGNNNLYYHNLSENSNVMVMNIGGKDFIISKPKVEWQLLNESKTIGNYLCYKAIMKDNNKVIAWYTPSITVGHGPNSFNGLPGLIIELSNKTLVFSVTKINISKTSKIKKIIKPVEGQKLTYEEFKKKFGGVFEE
jgi:GLPGLI family protein